MLPRSLWPLTERGTYNVFRRTYIWKYSVFEGTKLLQNRERRMTSPVVMDHGPLKIRRAVI